MFKWKAILSKEMAVPNVLLLACTYFVVFARPPEFTFTFAIPTLCYCTLITRGFTAYRLSMKMLFAAFMLLSSERILTAPLYERSLCLST